MVLRPIELSALDDGDRQTSRNVSDDISERHSGNQYYYLAFLRGVGSMLNLRSSCASVKNDSLMSLKLTLS